MSESSKRATLTVEEVAEVLGIGRNTAYVAVREGRIPSLRIGRRVVVPKDAVDRMLQGAGDAPDAA